MVASSTAIVLDGLGVTRSAFAVVTELGTVSSAAVRDGLGARVFSDAMLGGSAAVTSGAMRDRLVFSAVSPTIGKSAAAIESGSVVEGIAKKVSWGSVLVMGSSPPLVRAATAAPTGGLSAEAVGVIAASGLVLGLSITVATSSVSARTRAAVGVGPGRDAMLAVWSESSERLGDTKFITPVAPSLLAGASMRVSS